MQQVAKQFSSIGLSKFEVKVPSNQLELVLSHAKVLVFYVLEPTAQAEDYTVRFSTDLGFAGISPSCDPLLKSSYYPEIELKVFFAATP